MPITVYDKKIFAKNLQRYLDINNKKAIDISRYLEVSKSTVSSWLNAEKMPRMDKIERLAQWFNIQKSDLIEETPSTISSAKQKLLAVAEDLSDEQILKLLSIIEEVKKLV